MPEECQSLMDSLRVLIVDVAMEDILKVTEEMIEILEQQMQEKRTSTVYLDRAGFSIFFRVGFYSLL